MIARSLSTSKRRAMLHQIAGDKAEFCQALYPLIIAHADDEGRLDGSAWHVKFAVDPTSPRPEDDFEIALNALSLVGLITRYEVNGEKYLEINQFREHQPGLKLRENSKIPPPPSDGTSRQNPAKSGTAGSGREMPSELNRTELNRTEGKGREGKAADAAPTPPDEPPRDAEGRVVNRGGAWNPKALPARSGGLIDGAEIRRHGQHAACGRVCVTRAQHLEFARKLGSEDAEARLFAWYPSVLAQHEGEAIGDGDFEFWRKHFTAWIGTVAPEGPSLKTRGNASAAAIMRAGAKLRGAS